MLKTHRFDVRLTFMQSFACASIAGFTSKTITAPLDVIKVRYQLGTWDTLPTGAGYLRSISSLYGSEGLRAFWKGNFIGCLRIIPYSSIQLLTFQRVRLAFCDRFGRLTPWSAALAGASGGLVATVAMYPSDSVKTRLIAQHTCHRLAHYNGIADAVVTIYKEEGLLAFYRGVSTSLLAVLPFSGMMFLAYEVMDNIWEHYLHFSQSPIRGLINGCIAGAVAQTLTFPLDTVRKKMQVHYVTTGPQHAGWYHVIIGHLSRSTVDWNTMDGMLHDRLTGEMIRGGSDANIQTVQPVEQLQNDTAIQPEQQANQIHVTRPQSTTSQFTFTQATTRKMLRMVAEFSASGQRPRRQDYAKRMCEILGTGPFPDAEKIRLKIKSEKERFERQVKLNSRSEKPKVEIDPLLIEAFAPNGIPPVSSLGTKRTMDRTSCREANDPKSKRQKGQLVKKQKKTGMEVGEQDPEWKQDNVLDNMSEYLKTLTTKQDEDDLWLLSLGPALKRLEPLQKGLVKIKIQQFLLEAEFGVEVLSTNHHTISTQHLTPSPHQQMQATHLSHPDQHIAYSPVLWDRGNVDVPSPTIRAALSATIKKYGFWGLWRGCLINNMKIVPYTGLMFLTHEASKNFFIYHNGYTTCPIVGSPIPGIPQNESLHEENAMGDEDIY